VSVFAFREQQRACYKAQQKKWTASLSCLWITNHIKFTNIHEILNYYYVLRSKYTNVKEWNLCTYLFITFQYINKSNKLTSESSFTHCTTNSTTERAKTWCVFNCQRGQEEREVTATKILRALLTIKIFHWCSVTKWRT